MIPITRKELYLNKIIGNNDYSVPEKPISEEEFFFAEILGEAVQAPEPLTRYQIYLAKIAGRDIEIPYPETRLEYFLARAAGMDVTIPTPITREEIFWADYALIVEKELSGIPPLTFNAIAGTLKNYHIYGNTVNGESVGDLVTDSQSEHYGNYAIPITNNSETANIYLNEPLRKVGDEAEYVDYAEQKWYRVRKNQVVSNVTSRTIDNGDGTFFYITANHDGSVTCNGYAKSTIFINNSYIAELEASTRYILSGCPQGGKYMSYRLDLRFPTGQAIDPIVDYGIGYTFSVDTPGIYAPTVRIAAGYTCDNLTFYPMIRKADIEDDTYEPYIEDTEVDVTLPEIAVTAGTNTLTVGTEVQPSNVYIKYEGEK